MGEHANYEEVEVNVIGHRPERSPFATKRRVLDRFNHLALERVVDIDLSSIFYDLNKASCAKAAKRCWTAWWSYNCDHASSNCLRIRIVVARANTMKNCLNSVPEAVWIISWLLEYPKTDSFRGVMVNGV